MSTAYCLCKWGWCLFAKVYVSERNSRKISVKCRFMPSEMKKNLVPWTIFMESSYICKVFLQRHHFILLNFSAELRPRKRFYEQNQISIGAAHHSADSTIGYLGLSQAWLRIWDGVCAFFMPVWLVLSPQNLEMKVITIKRSKIWNQNQLDCILG